MTPVSLEKKTLERRGNEPPISVAEFEAAIRAVGPERYHDLHPFHHLLHGGKLNKGQVQAWALNRYCYQSAVPRKDAALISRVHDRELRREWTHRVLDHDGQPPDEIGVTFPEQVGHVDRVRPIVGDHRPSSSPLPSPESRPATLTSDHPGTDRVPGPLGNQPPIDADFPGPWDR